MIDFYIMEGLDGSNLELICKEILNNLKKVAKKYELSFYCPDDEDQDMGAFVCYSFDGKVVRNYKIREDGDELIYFIKKLACK